MKSITAFCLALAALTGPLSVSSAAQSGSIDGKPDVLQALHAPEETEPRVVSLRLLGRFNDYERAKILRAVNAWNFALNGFVRFSLAPDGSKPVPNSWVIAAAATSPVRDGRERPLALTQPLPSGGGLVIVFLDRVNDKDIGTVVMHEMGHVLGLQHDAHGGLMAPRYRLIGQECIDHATAAQLAALRHLPLDRLNWCADAR